MIIEPKIRGYICTTAHPAGCAAHVEEAIELVRKRGPVRGPSRAVVVGASTGYGLATRIAAAFGCGAGTLGVFLEKPAEGKRTASAGWYNSAAFTRAARRAGLYAGNVNGDAFTEEVRRLAVERIRADLGQVDLVVYSVAAPRRTHPATGEKFASVLKPIGREYASKSVDVMSGRVTEVRIEAASEDEIRQTVAVMGGEDWTLWIRALREAGALARGVVTLAYSYLGPDLTFPIYRNGTIGRAKDDLELAARTLGEELAPLEGRAYVSVNKAVVTQSSSAIPVVPLYISLLFRVMKEKGLHEGTTEQMVRLFAGRLAAGPDVPVDGQGRIRLDDLEMRDDVQREVARLWEEVATENLEALSDLAGYRRDFQRLFGFQVEGVDYGADVDPAVDLDPA